MNNYKSKFFGYEKADKSPANKERQTFSPGVSNRNKLIRFESIEGNNMNAIRNLLNRTFQLLGLVLHSLLAAISAILRAVLGSNASRGITL